MEHHLTFLLPQPTLDKWAGSSLDERASLFKKQFPDAELSGSKLWRIYHQNGIRYKFVLTKKFVPPHR